MSSDGETSSAIYISSDADHCEPAPRRRRRRRQRYVESAARTTRAVLRPRPPTVPSADKRQRCQAPRVRHITNCSPSPENRPDRFTIFREKPWRKKAKADTQLQQARSRSAEMQGRCVKISATADTFEAKIQSYRARAFDYDLQVHFRKRQAERQRTGRDPDVDWAKKCAKRIQRYRARYFDSYLRSNGDGDDLPLYLKRNERILAEHDLYSSTDDDLKPQQPSDDGLQVRVAKKEGVWAEPALALHESRT